MYVLSSCVSVVVLLHLFLLCCLHGSEHQEQQAEPFQFLLHALPLVLSHFAQVCSLAVGLVCRIVTEKVLMVNGWIDLLLDTLLSFSLYTYSQKLFESKRN